MHLIKSANRYRNAILRRQSKPRAVRQNKYRVGIYAPCTRYKRDYFCAILELEIVLGYSKFRPFLQEVPISIPRFLDQLTVHAIMLTNAPPITFIKEDPSDNKFLACALVTSAEYIISGDAHLLKLKSFQGIPILTPRGFLKSVSFLK